MTSAVLWTNRAQASLAASITNSQTTLTLNSGQGAQFPSPAASQFFPVTLQSATNGTVYEIAYCTARSTDTLTITRAQEGTTGLAFNQNDLVLLEPTAGTMPQVPNGYAVGGALSGTLPDPTIAANVNLPGSPTVGVAPAGSDDSLKVASTSFLYTCMSFVASAAGFVFSPGNPGYIKFPSWLGGLILQFGNNNVGSSLTVAYPIAFPNVPLSVSHAIGGTGVQSLSPPLFNIRNAGASNSQFVIYNDNPGNIAVDWLVIGY